MLSRISDVMLFSISRGFVQRYGGSATKGVGVGRSWGRAELGAEAGPAISCGQKTRPFVRYPEW